MTSGEHAIYGYELAPELRTALTAALPAAAAFQPLWAKTCAPPAPRCRAF